MTIKRSRRRIRGLLTTAGSLVSQRFFDEWAARRKEAPEKARATKRLTSSSVLWGPAITRGV